MQKKYRKLDRRLARGGNDIILDIKKIQYSDFKEYYNSFMELFCILCDYIFIFGMILVSEIRWKFTFLRHRAEQHEC